jgi:hypothetical protein
MFLDCFQYNCGFFLMIGHHELYDPIHRVQPSNNIIPLFLINYDNPVEMIWHDYKFIQSNIIVMVRQIKPTLFYNFSIVV